MKIIDLGLILGGLIIGAGALSACSPPERAPETVGVSQKDKMDLATKLYAECITNMTASAAVNNDAAGSIANRVLLECREKRNTLTADVIAFHQIGHPKFSIAQSKAVAEASIATIEDELRRQTVVSIVSRQLGSGSTLPGSATGSAPIAPEETGGTGDTGQLKLEKGAP